VRARRVRKITVIASPELKAISREEI
jgi:hypothetical protein